MTRVGAIQSNDRRNNYLAQITEGAVIGTAMGYGAKYLLPLTSEEKSTNQYVRVIDGINAHKNMYSSETSRFLYNLKNQEQSLAKDEFVKMFDGMKHGDKVKTSSIRKALTNLQDKPTELKEFKKICKSASELAEKIAKQHVDAYNLAAKHLRPTGFFMVTGAVVGAVMSLINEFLKTEIKE